MTATGIGDNRNIIGLMVEILRKWFLNCKEEGNYIEAPFKRWFIIIAASMHETSPPCIIPHLLIIAGSVKILLVGISD